MEIGTCPRCNEYKINPQSCGCKLFLCWIDQELLDDLDEATEVYATDYGYAAEERASQWSDATYNSSAMDVFVKRPNDKEQRHFIVEAEIDIVFYAREE